MKLLPSQQIVISTDGQIMPSQQLLPLDGQIPNKNVHDSQAAYADFTSSLPEYWNNTNSVHEDIADLQAPHQISLVSEISDKNSSNSSLTRIETNKVDVGARVEEAVDW